MTKLEIVKLIVRALLLYSRQPPCTQEEFEKELMRDL